ncbi:MAG TPA: hydroxymethylbilane synthase, partial [Erythrobacter sp.]|nr:hydroxymethylbilane synthase [Erythrobacter sp.]
MAQAHEARARLCAAHGWDESAVELVPVVASGDRIQDRPLAEIGGKALWTRELDQWL